MEDLQARDAEKPQSAAKAEHHGNSSSNGHSAEFRVRGGPWDASNQSDFPSLSSPAKASAPAGAIHALPHCISLPQECGAASKPY